MSEAMQDETQHLVEDQLCFAIYSTMHAVNRAYQPLLQRLGLTYSQYLVMLVLWQRDDVTLKAIGERLFLDSGTLTPLLKRLEAAGLLQRRRNPADEREVLLRLTKAGAALSAVARSLPVEMACAMAQPRAKLDALKGELLTLRSNLLAGLDTEAKAACTAS